MSRLQSDILDHLKARGEGTYISFHRHERDILAKPTNNPIEHFLLTERTQRFINVKRMTIVRSPKWNKLLRLDILTPRLRSVSLRLALLYPNLGLFIKRLQFLPMR